MSKKTYLVLIVTMRHTGVPESNPSQLRSAERWKFFFFTLTGEAVYVGYLIIEG